MQSETETDNHFIVNQNSLAKFWKSFQFNQIQRNTAQIEHASLQGRARLSQRRPIRAPIAALGQTRPTLSGFRSRMDNNLVPVRVGHDYGFVDLASGNRWEITFRYRSDRFHSESLATWRGKWSRNWRPSALPQWVNPCPTRISWADAETFQRTRDVEVPPPV